MPTTAHFSNGKRSFFAAYHKITVMTIWRQENPVPTNLPPAQLFLEDIQEIIDIFVELLADPKLDSEGIENSPQVEFRIGKEFCNEVQELSKIAQRTTDFRIHVSRRRSGYPSVTFGVEKDATQWTSLGLPKDCVWEGFRKLETLFAKRRLRWRSLFNQQALYFMEGAANPLLVVGGLSLLIPKTALLATRIIAFAAILALNTVLWVTLSHHSIVVLRNSWDHAARRDDLNRKIIAGVVPTLIGTFLGSIGTILGIYFKHKFWP